MKSKLVIFWNIVVLSSACFAQINTNNAPVITLCTKIVLIRIVPN
jgi:hypothetical protein